jgi:hypothetical protein
MYLVGFLFETEIEPEEKFFQGGLERFCKQVRKWLRFINTCISHKKL